MSDAKLQPLLIVEDDPGLQKQLQWSFTGYKVTIAEDRVSALKQIKAIKPPVVTLDLGLPPDSANASEGLAVLEEIQKLYPHTKVIVVTGNDDRENALKAIGLGAYDFYQKPVDPDILGLIIDRAYKLYELEKGYRELRSNQPYAALQGVIAASPNMLKVCRIVEKVAPTNATTLLLGESGTGKEIIARALHNLSDRKDKPFVAINSAAIPETLLESELFGYEKGAFTGANKQTPGKLEYADGGTFFIDEVGDLPAALQAKILRFLQERVIERVGGRKEIPIDVRIICATHQDLRQLISDHSFREDLFYRISEVIIDIPPLRERDGDVILLAQSFLSRLNSENRSTNKSFANEALTALNQYRWPGNVRELENCVKRAYIMSEGNQITAAELGLESYVGGSGDEVMVTNLRQIRDQAELVALQRALHISNRNISQAAELLGVSRPTLYDLMNKFGLT